MIATGTLADRRSFVWMPAYSPSEAGWDGILTISQETGVRVRRTVSDRYAVEFQRSEGFPGKVFLVCKEKHTGDLDTVAGRKSAENVGEVYQVSIGQAVKSCTCTGFQTRAGSAPIECKHIKTLAAALEQGAIEHVEPSADPRDDIPF